MTFDDRILIALYNATNEHGLGGYRISQLMPEGSSFFDGREVATRLVDQGYITLPQGMSASPTIQITEKGCKRVQSLSD